MSFSPRIVLVKICGCQRGLFKRDSRLLPAKENVGSNLFHIGTLIVKLVYC